MMKNQLDVQQENNEVMNSWFFHTNKYLFRLTLKEKPKAANVPLNNIGLFSFLFFSKIIKKVLYLISDHL